MKRISLILMLSLVCFALPALADGYHTITSHDVEIRFEVVSPASVKLYSVTNRSKDALKVRLDGVEKSGVLKPGKTAEYGGVECKLIQTIVNYESYTILNERILGKYLVSISPPSSESVEDKLEDASEGDVQKRDTEAVKPEVQVEKVSDIQVEEVEGNPAVDQVGTGTEEKPEIRKRTVQTGTPETQKRTGPEKKPELQKQAEQKKSESRVHTERATKPVGQFVPIPDSESEADKPKSSPDLQDSAGLSIPHPASVPGVMESVTEVSLTAAVYSGDVWESFISELDSDNSFFSNARLEDLARAVRNYRTGLDTCTTAVRKFKFIRNHHVDIYLDKQKCDLSLDAGRIEEIVSSFMDKYQIVCEADSLTAYRDSLSAFLSDRASVRRNLLRDLEKSMEVGADFPRLTYSFIILVIVALTVIFSWKRYRAGRKSAVTARKESE